MVTPQVHAKVIERLGQQGQDWLDGIPRLLKQAATQQHFTVLRGPLHEGTMSVAFQVQDQYGKAVIKFPSPDADSNEITALQAWADNPFVGSLIAHHPEWIMTRWIEGVRPELSTVSMPLLSDLLKSLQNYNAPTKQLVTVEQRMDKMFRSRWVQGSMLQQLAYRRTQQLVATTPYDTLIHGDLASKNLLINQNKAFVIDPLGLWGDAAYILLFCW